MKEVKFQWPLGFQSGAVHAGFKANDALDLCWVVSDHPAAAAGVYTKNQFQAAPVQFTKHLIDQHHQLQAIVVNSGNANSFTGQQGLDTVDQQSQLVSEKLHIDPQLVGVASTGVIGKQLSMPTFVNGVKQLDRSDSTQATEAILTTDTHAKKVSYQFLADGKKVTMTGFAKGSGMIHPNMGTTLSFITTDANVDAEVLQSLLKDNITKSFNQITVDGCMSTNDMVITMANGEANNDQITPTHPDYEAFKQCYLAVLMFLAKAVAADGEGANKLVEVKVTSAENVKQANQVAKAIVGSNLVKAMLFGEDGNFGRIVQAIGQTNAKVDLNHLSIEIGDVVMVKDSVVQSYDWDHLKAILAKDQIHIEADLNVGDASGLAWGCDLTYQYVEINAAYEG